MNQVQKACRRVLEQPAVDGFGGTMADQLTRVMLQKYEVVEFTKPVTELTETEIAQLPQEIQLTVRNYIKEKSQ